MLEYLAYTGSDVSDKEVNKNRTLFGNSKLDNGVVVFSYDGVADKNSTALENSDFAVLNLADVETEKELQGTHYYMDGSSIAVMLIKDKYTGADSIYAVLNSALAGYNADDDKAFKVEGFANGKEYVGWTADRNTGDLSDAFGTAEDVKVYKLTIDSNDVITDAEITTGEAFVNATIPVVGDITDKDGNYLIQVEGTWYTIDPNAVVYSYSVADKEFDTAKLSDIKKERNSIEASKVYLYQMDDDSEVVDFIIIYDGDNADDSEQPENPDESQTETPEGEQTETPEGGAGN